MNHEMQNPHNLHQRLFADESPLVLPIRDLEPRPGLPFDVPPNLAVLRQAAPLRIPVRAG